jgi:hypothetical protein
VRKIALGLLLLVGVYYGPNAVWATCGSHAAGTWLGDCEVLGACTPTQTNNYQCESTSCVIIVNGQVTQTNHATICTPVQGCANGGDPALDKQCTPETGCPTCPGYKVCPATCHVSPIIIDLSGNGFALTNAENGVAFDISGSGLPVQMGWTAKGADNAFLALPGDDGEVHNGQQLFGSFTPQPKSDTPNGFAALAVYDTNHDGVIDAKDPIWPRLRLWIDTDHNGVAETNELHTLPSLGVNSLSLHYEESRKTDQYGNQFRYHALVDPGSHNAYSGGRVAYDVFFVSEGGN